MKKISIKEYNDQELVFMVYKTERLYKCRNSPILKILLDYVVDYRPEQYKALVIKIESDSK